MSEVHTVKPYMLKQGTIADVCSGLDTVNSDQAGGDGLHYHHQCEGVASQCGTNI